VSKKSHQTGPIPLQEGYQPKLTGLKGKDGQPLQSGALDPKNLKPPRNWESAIQPPKPVAGGKSS
jgi:hypothetical protein